MKQAMTPGRRYRDLPLREPSMDIDKGSVWIRKINEILEYIRDTLRSNEIEISQKSLELLKRKQKEIREYRKAAKAKQRKTLSSDVLEVSPSEASQTPQEQKCIPLELAIALDNLLKAILALAEYINETIRIKQKGQQQVSEGDKRLLIEIGCKINHYFTAFFLYLATASNLQKENIIQVYDHIFERANSLNSLRQKLEKVNLGSIPPGILAVVEAIFYLKEEYPNQVFYAPTVDQDMEGIDLISEKRNKEKVTEEMSLYQIKGRKEYGKVNIFDLSEDEKYKKLELKLKSAEYGGSDLQTLQRLLYYRRKLESEKGIPVKAYWVEVSIPAR